MTGGILWGTKWKFSKRFRCLTLLYSALAYLNCRRLCRTLSLFQAPTPEAGSLEQANVSYFLLFSYGQELEDESTKATLLSAFNY